MASGIIDAARSPGTYHDWSGLTGTTSYYHQNAPGYGIHIGNHSYAYTIASGDKQEDSLFGGGAFGPGEYSECYLCRESFLFSLRNGVTSVVARGNRPDFSQFNFSTNLEGDFIYPARYDDSWVISVSSSGNDGNRLIGAMNSTDDYFGYYGGDVDLLAPGGSDIVRTTTSTQAPGVSELYGSFNGTSSAAPHVAGVAALMLSAYNKNCYSNVNLDPTDVEYILQESATWTEENNVDGNYSNASGHGRLNAYQALKMIELPKYQIVHPDTLPISQQVIEQDTISIRAASPLTLNSSSPIGSQYPLTINTDYRVVRYKYQLQYDFNQYMQPSTTLLDTWVRHSQTNSFRMHVDTNWTIDTIIGGMGGVSYDPILLIDSLGIEPMCQIDSVLNDSIIYLSGYYYHFIEQYDFYLDILGSPSNVSSSSMNTWYPIDPNLLQPKMAFSIYIHDDSLNSQYDFPCYADNNLIDSFAYVLQTEKSPPFEIFPNPGTNQLSIRLPELSKGKIVMHDVFGRLIHEINISHKTLYFIDTEATKRGVYFVTYITENGQSSKKWIKQ